MMMRAKTPEAVEKVRQQKSAAGGRARRKTATLRDQVKKDPKCKSKVFICVGDYDKWQRTRGQYSTVCALTFLLCMAKQARPLLR